MHRSLAPFFLFAAASCAPPSRDVTLAELAPQAVVDIEVGPDNANIIFESADPRGYDPSSCPQLHGVSATIAGLADDATHSNAGGSYMAVDPGGGTLVPRCAIPLFVVPLAGRSFDPSAPTAIRVSDGTTTVAIDARNVFAAPTFRIGSPDGFLRPGGSTALLVSPQFHFASAGECLFTPDDPTAPAADVPVTVADDALTLEVPAEVQPGHGQLDCQLSMSAPIDRCDGASSCSVSLNRDLEQTFDATVVSP